jgi:hypothetical protein
MPLQRDSVEYAADDADILHADSHGHESIEAVEKRIKIDILKKQSKGKLEKRGETLGLWYCAFQGGALHYFPSNMFCFVSMC